MKRILFLLSMLLGIGLTTVSAQSVDAALAGHILTRSASAATTIEEGWYVLNNVGRANSPFDNGTAFKMGALPAASYLSGSSSAGYLFHLTKSTTAGSWYICSGLGHYVQLGSNSSTQTSTKRNFTIEKIGSSTDVFCIRDTQSGYYADGQQNGYNFVGWSTTKPTSTTGNSAYRLFKVSEAFVTAEDMEHLQDATWYQLSVRNKYITYDAASQSYYDTDATRPDASNKASWFAFVGNTTDGFRIINYTAGPEVAMGADDVNTNTRLHAVPQASAHQYLFELVTYSNAPAIQIREKNNNNAFLNQQATNLGYWNHNARGDIGNIFTFTPVEGVSVQTKTYTMHISGAPSADVTAGYAGQQYSDGQTFRAFELDESLITTTDVNGYDVSTSVSGTTINVTYTLKEFTVTYKLVNADAPTDEWASETYNGLHVGDDLPALATTHPEMTVINAPSGKVVCDKTYTIYCVAQVPVTLVGAFTNDESKATLLSFGKNKRYLHYTAGQANIPVTATTAGTGSDYLWQFVGNPFTGYQIYNLAAGADMVLAIPTSTTQDGNTGGNTYPVLTSKSALTASSVSIWKFKDLGRADGAFLIGFNDNGTDVWMNDRSSKLAFWNQDYDNGSYFFLEAPEQGSQKPANVAVTYAYTYKGETVHTGTAHTVANGAAYPDLDTLPSGVNATKPAGNVDADGDITVPVEVSYNMPFEFFPTLEKANVWYHMTIKGYLMNYEAGTSNDYMTLSATSGSDDKYKFAFVGNPFTGFTVYNKAAGNGYVLSSTQPDPNTSTGGRNFIKMRQLPLASGYNMTWDFTPFSGGHILSRHGDTAQHRYANVRDAIISGKNILAYWTGNEDNGSKITFSEVERIEPGTIVTTNPATVVPGHGKVYRFYSRITPGRMIYENTTDGGLYVTNRKDDTNMSQMWVALLTDEANNGFTLMNLETGHYMKATTKSAQAFVSESAQNVFLRPSNDGNYYGLCEYKDGTGNGNLNNGNSALGWKVVGWSWSATGTSTGSDWVVEEINYGVGGAPTLAEVKERVKSHSTFGEITSGHYYRLLSHAYDTRYLTEDYNGNNGLMGSPAGTVGNDNCQIWQATGDATNGYKLQNVLTGRYIADQASQSSQFVTTDNAAQAKAFKVVAEGGDEWIAPRYAFYRSASDKHSLHCASSQSYQVVSWTYENANASYWKLENVELTDDDVEAIREEYAAYKGEAEVLAGINANAADLNATLQQFFTDYACTEMRSNYKSLTDKQLRTIMAHEGLPVSAQDMAISVKNDRWDNDDDRNHYTKMFRINDYRIYSDRHAWRAITNVGPFGELVNPTGITVNIDDVVYIYVDDDPKDSDAEIFVELAEHTNHTGVTTPLHKGINAYRATKNGELFIGYFLKNTAKYLADYPNICVHIEGGQATGTWDMSRGMTNADWNWLSENMFEAPYLRVKGKSTVLGLVTDKVRGADNVEGILKIWDFIFETEERLIGHDGQWDGRYYPVITPRDCDASINPNWGGNCGTNHPGISKSYLFNFEEMVNGVGHLWEIYHEEAHAHQYPINLAATTESSNNGYAQMVNYEFGSYNSRQKGVETLITFKNNGWGWVDILRGGEGTSRSNGFEYYGDALWAQCHMFFQLYLYFHVQGHMPDFWPRVADAMRANGGITYGRSVADPGYYYNDYLKFAKVCSEVSKTDLYEFFDTWGFFAYYDEVKVGNTYEGFYTKDNDAAGVRFVGDYGSYYLKMPVRTNPEDVQYLADLKAFMKSQPNKAPNIMFIDDHIRDMYVTDTCFIAREDIYPSRRGTVQGYFGVTRGTSGDFGMFTDFTGNNEANNIDYTISGNKVTMTGNGMVGIKIYDADGNLIRIYNTREFNVDDAVATALRNGTSTLVAALADDTNLPIAKPGTTTYAMEVYDGSADHKQQYLTAGTTINPNVPYVTTTTGTDIPALHGNAIARFNVTSTSLPAALRNMKNTIYKSGTSSYVAPLIELTDKQNYYAPVAYTATSAQYVRSTTTELNSLCLPFAVRATDFGTGCKIYVLTSIGDDNVTFTEATQAAAGQFCLVGCPEGGSWSLNLSSRSAVGTPSTTNAQSVGSFSNETIGEGMFKLNSTGTQFGITTAAGKVTAFRGYINAGSSKVRSLSLNLEELPEGIDATTADTDIVTRGTDLEGRSTLTFQRGNTYIINGKKTIIR